MNRYRPYRPRNVADRATIALGGLHRLRREPGVGAAQRFTVGMEEELFLVDAASLDCVAEMPAAFLAEAKAALGDHVKREIISSMVELVTSTHTSLAAAGHELAALRASLAEIAARHGLALLACGTHPFADWRVQTLTPKARYDRVAIDLGGLTTRVHLCGLHIHVAVPDPDMRISVMNRAQGFLPLFLALSTSSPFWRGAATGLSSYRSAANDETPRTGLPTRFADRSEFDRFVEKLQKAGFIPDQTFLWWAIRPSLKYPTLELRIADSCTNWRHSIAIAALYRALVHALVADPTLGADWEDHHYLVNAENRWQVIRYGLDANLLDPVTGTTRPLRDCVRALRELLRPMPRRSARHASSTISTTSCCTAPARSGSSPPSTPRSRRAPATTRRCIALPPTSRRARWRPEAGRRGGDFTLALMLWSRHARHSERVAKEAKRGRGHSFAPQRRAGSLACGRRSISRRRDPARCACGIARSRSISPTSMCVAAASTLPIHIASR